MIARLDSLKQISILVVFVCFVIPAAASVPFEVEPKEACEAGLSAKCEAREGRIELGDICQSSFQERLEKNLEYVNNGSADCSELEREEVEKALEPPLSEQIKNSAPALLVLTAVLGVLVSPFIASMILSVYYGEDKTEKLYLISYSSLISVLTFIIFPLYLVTIGILNNFSAYLPFSYSPVFSILFYGFPAVLGIILYAYISLKATRKLINDADIQNRRLRRWIFTLSFAFGLILTLSLLVIILTQNSFAEFGY